MCVEVILLGVDIKIQFAKTVVGYKNEKAVKFPNKLKYPNITSLKNAKEMHKNGLKIKPTYEDFIEMVRMNLEPSFIYKKRRFGSTKFDGFEFYE